MQSRDKSPVRSKKTKKLDPLKDCLCDEEFSEERKCHNCFRFYCIACVYAYEDKVMAFASCKDCLTLEAKDEGLVGCGHVYRTAWLKREKASDANVVSKQKR